MPHIPEDLLSRSDWANLSWKEAQTTVAKMLNNAGYMIFEEKRLGNSKRTDVLVINTDESNVNLGIIEVKAYRKITPKMVQNSILQACKYLNAWKHELEFKHKWGNKNRTYFIAVVFTNDYPINFSANAESNVKDSLSYYFDNHEMPKVIVSTPNSLLLKLRELGVLAANQAKLDDYFL